MVYPNSVVRCTIAGTSFGGAEIWSTGFWLGHTDGGAEDPTQVAADEIRALWETFFEGGKIHSNFRTTSVKLALHTANGPIDESKTVFAVIQNDIVGASSLAPQPPQIAIVVSLLSAKARGKAAKGRMFLPGPAFSVNTAGHYPTSDRDSIATSMQTFFNGIRASANIPWDPILVSPGPDFANPGETETMTRIRVGDVFDTQRRRRNQLAESYADRTLT